MLDDGDANVESIFFMLGRESALRRVAERRNDELEASTCSQRLALPCKKENKKKVSCSATLVVEHVQHTQTDNVADRRESASKVCHEDVYFGIVTNGISATRIMAPTARCDVFAPSARSNCTNASWA